MVPLAVCVGSVACDAVDLAGGGPGWRSVAAYAMAAGVVGGFLATLPDLAHPLDGIERAVRRRRLARAAFVLAAVALGLVNLWIRVDAARSGTLSVLLSAAAAVLVASGARAAMPAAVVQPETASMRRRYFSSTTGHR